MSARGSTTEAMKLFLDPRQAHVKTIKAGLEALLERLGLTHHGLLLSMSRGTGNNKGHPRRDPADDRNAGHHHHDAHQTTRKRDRHVIPIPRGRYGGDGPPETVTPRHRTCRPGTPRSSSHTAEPPRTTTPADTPETMMTVRIAVARATEPLVSTHEILLTRHSLRPPSAWASWISCTRSVPEFERSPTSGRCMPPAASTSPPWPRTSPPPAVSSAVGSRIDRA